MAIYQVPDGLPADREDIVKEVYEDVRAGLSEHLTPTSFALDGPFADRGALVDGDLAVVQWVFEGVDNRVGFNNLWPTAKHVTVRGVTFVDLDARPHQFHRHVDWNGVSSQLGGSLGRAASPLLVKKPEDARFYADDHYTFEAE
jgi:hypothetical protein